MTIVLAALLTILERTNGSVAGGAPEPVRVIFDTDMDSDCDDVGALAMLHVLADRGEAEILATVVSSRHEWSPACVGALNTFYGRPNLLIGCPKKDGAMKNHAATSDKHECCCCGDSCEMKDMKDMKKP